MFKRSSGVLAHVTSLPSPHGVGTMGRTACEFIDFLAAAHQTYWQVLPLGHTGFGDSPYQCFSAAAGNPYLIDMDLLVEYGLLTADEVLDFTGHAVGGVCAFAIQNPKVRIYCDESMKRFKTVFPACGSDNSAIELTCDELYQYSGAIGWIDVCKLPETT